MFISTIHDINSLQALKNSGIDGIIIGIPHFSIRQCNVVPIEELSIWKAKCNELNLKLYINFLKLCHENEMDDVKQLLSTFKTLGIDGIYYADEGVFYEAKTIGYENCCIYQPETLITSSHDVKFYLNEGVLCVSLAHELSLDEIKTIAQKENNIEILLSGYYSIMYSRRPLITNYLNVIDCKNRKDSYILIESTRDGKMPIVQDEAGTHVFSEEAMASFKQFDELKTLNIQRFRIDSIFKDDEWTIQAMNAYKNHEIYEGSDRWYYQESIKKKGD